MALKPWEIDSRSTGGTPGRAPARPVNRSVDYYTDKYGIRSNVPTDTVGRDVNVARSDYYGQIPELRNVDWAQSESLDPGGLTAAEWAMINASTPSVNGPGGGGSGRGSGGGGGVDPRVSAAMQQYMQSVQARQNPYNDSLIAGLYNPATINQRFDRLGADVGSAAGAARTRVDEIAGGLNDRTAQAGTAIQGIVSDRMNAIRQLASELGSAGQADVAGMNQMLAANGAGTVQGEVAPLQNMMRASENTMADTGVLFAQSMADRAALSGQLQSDVNTGLARDEAGLMSQIAAQRASQTGALEDARLQALAQIKLQAAQWEAQKQQEEAQLRLQMAQMGLV